MTPTPKEVQLLQLTRYLNSHQWVLWLFAALAIWSLVWKGIALWKAARNNQMVWYVVMLIVNTVGILEIIYIAFFSRPKKS